MWEALLEEKCSPECRNHVRLAFYLGCTYTTQQKGALGNYCIFGTWDKNPIQRSLTQCKSRLINEFGSCQSLQGVKQVWCPGYIVCTSYPSLGSVWLSVLAPRAVGARGTKLPSELQVTCASSSGDPSTGLSLLLSIFLLFNTNQTGHKNIFFIKGE